MASGRTGTDHAGRKADGQAAQQGMQQNRRAAIAACEQGCSKRRVRRAAVQASPRGK